MHDPITDLIGRIIVEIFSWFVRLPRYVLYFFALCIGLLLGTFTVVMLKSMTVKSETVDTFIECDGDVCDRYAFECSGGLMYKTTISSQPVIKPVYDDDREQKKCDTEGYIK